MLHRVIACGSARGACATRVVTRVVVRVGRACNARNNMCATRVVVRVVCVVVVRVVVCGDFRIVVRVRNVNRHVGRGAKTRDLSSFAYGRENNSCYPSP